MVAYQVGMTSQATEASPRPTSPTRTTSQVLGHRRSAVSALRVPQQSRRRAPSGSSGADSDRGDTGDQPGEGDRRDSVRYDTPEFAGFVASAAWGEDDFWDIGLRYEGEFNGFKIDGRHRATARTLTTTGTVDDLMPANLRLHRCSDWRRVECNQFGGSISVMHESKRVSTPTSPPASSQDDDFCTIAFMTAPRRR